MTKKVREIVKILNRNGFIKIDQNGSHMKFYNPLTNRTVIVPNHRKDIPIGTEKSIWKQAGIKQ
ncbi:type II toxin-antitoxin system HicA family toxin [uncultured Enterococcus sp.]|uniref:type II toxin-antitoxin system HicA family toxin n=1 Tax=uncultured Enterococcus sp. TaxID=167972 RepID=UPI002639DB1D|nr:type II toxin-antitoxin system HicA family toxin [uncultured Enterococcus sp.]